MVPKGAFFVFSELGLGWDCLILIRVARSRQALGGSRDFSRRMKTKESKVQACKLKLSHFDGFLHDSSFQDDLDTYLTPTNLDRDSDPIRGV